MNEHKFIKTLQDRANEQEKLIRTMPLPKVFFSVSFWFGDHPWRILLPVAFIITSIFRITLGRPYDDFILKIFGKL